MPKIVEHELRRDEVVQATWRVMARVGIDRASIRKIADEAGYSTGAIAHYFKDKDDVIVSALEKAYRDEMERIVERTAGLSGLAALRASVVEVLPVGSEQTMEMAVWMGFWGRAVGDEKLKERQRHYYGQWRALLRGHIEDAVAAGEARPDVIPSDESFRIAALVDGIAIQAVLEPDRLSPARVVALVDAYIAMLKAEIGRAALGGVLKPSATGH